MRKNGFTLIELLVAMSIGLIIMNVAFTALFFTRKFVRKGEEIGAKNDIMQSMMVWSLYSKGTSSYPSGPQTRRMAGKFDGTVSVSSKTFNVARVYKYIDAAGKNVSTEAEAQLVGTLYFPAP